MIRRALLSVLIALAVQLGAAHARAGPSQPRIHVVYKGQHLGMIARRYNVSVDAIRRANSLDPRKPIRPGQRLLIPPQDDPDGSKTHAAAPRETPGAQAAAARPRAEPSKPPAAKPKSGPVRKDPPRIHRVAPRQHLGMIAKRYHSSVDAIRHANELSAKSPIRPGQELVIPWPEDEDGSAARKHADRSGRAGSAGATRSRADRSKGKGKKATWRDYRRPAWKRGYIQLSGPNGTWKGYVIGKGGKVLGNARKAFTKILATSDGKTSPIHPRLIRLIAKVSDAFGGLPIRVVSGYRLESTARRSRHKTGHALDFSIPGVPNWALRDYVKRFSKVGVGHYPNSSFIHLDVRDRWTYWVDYSGPGQAPRYGHITNRRPPLD
ncbi:MAG: LysM peptidoglycan-binding domain-containing protein [Deltaproteobacteria bacterium]|nr:LysM peptidoglycan-binding domain-containing protein [Deltaproteobacteria bacterium]MBW2531040.1 LysM peptidoglycan-binding domain-containing protein [Deltaproteobacteria bacterium]